MSRFGMKKSDSTRRREEALSRERIVETSIELLDSAGEAGLTFQTLSKRLATGPGAIYWHVANKADLLTAACDAIVAQAAGAVSTGATPEVTIRNLALGLFDAIDAHPWVGTALNRAPGKLPMVRILEGIGQQLRALGVRDDAQWAAASTLLSYVLGVGIQNAANAQFAQAGDLDRSTFLNAVSEEWSGLDPEKYPFTRSMAGTLAIHNDRADFLAGIDLILAGLTASPSL